MSEETMIYDPASSSWGNSLRVADYDTKRNLAHFGYAILKNTVPHHDITLAKRLLNLEIVNWGLSKEQVSEWHQTKSWFPTLRFHDEILNLARYVPKELYGDAELAEPQILCHYPDEATEWDFTYHLDQEPEWAKDLKYVLIAGVALTENTQVNGGLIVRPPFAPENAIGDPVILNPGDIVVFSPQLWHRGGLNQTGDVRMMAYFRWLEKEK